MKLIPLFALLFSFSAQAASDVQFKTRSPLPAEMRALVAQEISARCKADVVTIREENTRVQIFSVDQGQRDFFYFTEFTAQYYFDGQHPISVTIEVDSAQYDIQNPSVPNKEIRRFRADPSEMCR